MEDGAIDGLINLLTLDATGRAACARAGIPHLHVGYHENMPFAVLTDFHAMIADAVAALIGHGARRLTLVGDDIMAPPAFDALVRRLAGAVTGNGIVTEVLPGRVGVEAGARVARTLAERAADERPAAVIFVEDFAAAGAAREWVARGDYAPRLAVYANKQLPQVWPMPVLRYELDIEEQAAQGVRTMQEALLNPETPPRQEWVRARLAE